MKLNWIMSAVVLVLGVALPVQAQLNTADEPWSSGWSVSVDNDIFTGNGRDQDYTGGITLTLSGRRAVEYPVSLDWLRAGLDRLTGFDKLYNDASHFQLHSIEGGFALFTPRDITLNTPQPGDHPYASLFFMVNAEQTVLPRQKLSYQSVLTVGFLGLPLADAVQSGIHSAIGSAQPQGWQYQISEGGEPNFKYTLGVQKTVSDQRNANSIGHEFKLTGEANIGFTTDLDVGFNFRWGRISTP